MAANDQAPSRYETRGRAHKCWTIARWAINAGFTHEDAAEWSVDQWGFVADQAGVKLPSPKSRGQVIGYMTPSKWTPVRKANHG